MNRTTADLLKIAADLGFENLGVDGGGHHLVRHTNGESYRISGSPSEYRGFMNAIKDMERISGNKIDRPHHRRPKGRNSMAGFDLEAAAREQKQRRLLEALADEAKQVERERMIDWLRRKAKREKELKDVRWLMFQRP